MRRTGKQETASQRVSTTSTVVELRRTDAVGANPEGVRAAAKPCIRSNFRVEIVEPKHVYLLGEHASHVLTGRLYCTVVPLLDGRHSLDEIRDRLAGEIADDHLDHVVNRLARLGYLDDAADDVLPATAAFWNELGFDQKDVAPCLYRSEIGLTAVGDVDIAPFERMLSDVGITVVHDSTGAVGGPMARACHLHVVLTDDYLRPELEDINRAALRSGRPWMLVKPVGSVVWLGPVFVPDETGCWHCLAHRLQGNEEVKSSIVRQRGGSMSSPTCLPTSRAALPSTAQSALQWATTEIIKWVATRSLEASAEGRALTATLTGKMISWDHVRHEYGTHALPHRPQCPACGDPSLVARAGLRPIDLKPSPKRHVDDAGHRSATPEQTLEDHAHLLSPITGVVTELTRISDRRNPFVHTYKASHSMGSVGSLRGLRQLLRHKSSGKGTTDAQSRASGFCEAIERYSFIFQGDEPRRAARLATLGDAAIHPELCLQFSESQYARRGELNTESIGHDWIPMRFDPERAIEWTPLWSLTHRCHRFLPTAYCYLWYRLPDDHDFCRADSNGNAAGNTIEEAILQGLLEVIERDGVAVWWYNGLRRPRVDLASFDDPYFRNLERFYHGIGRELWVLDLTSDFGIPVVAAVSRKVDGGTQRLILGFGAHLDARIAVTRALTEMSQVGLELDKIPDAKIDPDSAGWLLGATLESKPYLAPDPSAPARQAKTFATRPSDDIRDDVVATVEIARRCGLEVLVLDLTRPDIGLNVVKVVVPGMRFFWQRFAHGRLYDVPVRMGWLKERTPETALNRTQMPF
jgi:ribosomal protein S12 methylthiotransferase accessory factor